MGIHTKLQWVLSGPTKLNDSGFSHTNLATTHVDTQLDNRLKSFWELENLGICEPEKTIYDEFSESITFNDGRYQVSLPWRQQHKPLPENYQLSLHQLQGLLKRLPMSFRNTIQEYKSRSRWVLWRMFQQATSNPPKFTIFPPCSHPH